MKIAVDFCGEDCSRCLHFENKNSDKRLALVKKKVSKHYVPPDMNAIKMMLEKDEINLQSLTDKELKKVKKQILNEIKSGGHYE